MSKWWNTDMAAAAQALNGDPATALQAATLPAILLKQQQVYKKQQEEYLKSKERADEEEDRLGWINTLASGAMKAIGKVDNILSEVPIWDDTKEIVGYPIDKVASGMHWAYSNYMSRPLATLFLATAEAELSGDYLDTITKGETWSKPWEGIGYTPFDPTKEEAEELEERPGRLSPGQAFVNYENVAAATGEAGAFASIFAGGAENLTPEEREAVKRNASRYLYDNDFWHEKQGWTYTTGSGGLDFFFIAAGDPTYLAVKTAAPIVKGARNLTLAEAGKTKEAKGIVEGQRVTSLGEHSLEEVVSGKAMQDFAAWIPKKIPEQIALNPIWGKGRRKNPHTNQYSQLLAGERPESVGMIMRFAGGDSAAMREMATNSRNLTTKIGRLQDNRSLVDSAKFDPDVLAHYVEAERLYPQAAPDFVSPLSKGEELHQEAARAISGGLTSAMPKGGAADTTLAFLAKAEEWKAAQLKLIDEELEHLKSHDNFYQKILGGAEDAGNYGLHGDELTAAGSNLFGTMDSFHRMGPLAMRNTQKLADKRWKSKTAGRSMLAPKRAPGAKALASRVIRTGMYSTPIRLFQTFGDEMPSTFIDHSAPDATERVINTVRGVKGLPDDLRRSMIQGYSTAGDKLARSAYMEQMNTAIVEHMAAQRGIDGETARHIAGQLRVKMQGEHAKITGIRNPDEKFGTLSQTDASGQVVEVLDPVTGHRIDAVVDGEAWIIAPTAKTQLSRAEPLLDVKELGRFLDRSAGLIKKSRAGGADVADAVLAVTDLMSGVWKLATLMRPGYVIRNVTEAQMAAAAKFGALGVVNALGRGAAHWFENRPRQIAAFAGVGSWMPSTGKGVMSQMGRVKIGDAGEVARFSKLSFEGKQVPLTRINVPIAVDYAEGVIKTEQGLFAEAKAAMEKTQAEYDAWVGAHRDYATNQVALDSAASDLSDAYARTAYLRQKVSEARVEIVGKRYQRVAEERPTVGAEAETAAQAAAKDSDELAILHAEADRFLREAERGADDLRTQWGDSNWKYNAQQLDELRAWSAKVAKEQQKATIKTGVSEAALANANKVAKERIAEFDKVMKGLVGDRDWWQKALTQAERNELEARKILGEKAYKANYVSQPNMAEGKRLLEASMRHQAAMDDHSSVVREYSDYAGAIIREAERAQGKRLGEKEYEYRGITIKEAYNPKWDNPIVRDEITSKYGNQVMFSRYEAVNKERMAKTGAWVDITPDMPTHMDEWLRAVNLQFGQDELFRLVAEDPDKAAAWLKTAAGKKHAAELGPHGKEPEDLPRKIELLLDQYVPVEGGIRDKFIRGEEVYAKDLRAALPENAFPVVHGEEVRVLLKKERKTTASAHIDNLIARTFNRFGTIPTDVLANHPIYLMAQRARMKELVDKEIALRKEGGLGEFIPDEKTMNQMLAKSDQLARKDITQVVYDPTRTSATEGLRFVAPFLSAHIDGLQRWSGLMAEKPHLISRASQIYNAPVAANLITDKQGNHVDGSGHVLIKDADGKVVERKFVPLSERVFHLRRPGQNPDKQSKGSTPIALSAMNVIAPGDPWFNPGGGPLVQISGNFIAKEVPAAGEFLQWAKVLPFGPTDTATALTPKWMRESWLAYTAGEEGNQKYQDALLAVHNKHMADWRRGGGDGAKPSWKRAEKEAKSFMFIEALTAFSTPAQTMETPLTGTPYQFYIDQFRQLQETNPEDAREIFWSRYGEDYYQFTTSLSKSMGIAPTIEAVYTSEEYKDMIEMDPDLAGFIMSQRDKGEFSSTAYAVQMDQLIGGERVRSKLTAEQAAKLNEAQAGWMKYSKMMNLVDSMLLKVGFKSYQQKGAEKFALLKTIIQSQVAEEYPAWDEDFNQVDMAKVPKRIESLSRLVMDPRLANDPMRTDVPVMQQYLMMRAVFKQKLTDMGLKQLSFTPGAGPTQEGTPAEPSGEAKALGAQWRLVQMSLVSRDTQFGEMFHRYLSNDNLQ